MTDLPIHSPSLPVTSDVAVVVVTYHGAPWIRACLGSLASSTLRPRVIVVDNASRDATVQIIESEFPDVQLIRHPRNSGFGIGNNIGIRLALDAGASFIFLLNQDAFVLPTSIDELRAFMQAHPEFGVVSPLHCSPDQNHIDLRTLRGYLQTHLPEYLADACVDRTRAYYKTHGVNAAAWFVRSDVFRHTGGFDPLFFMYGEDDDLLNRWKHQRVSFALLTGSRIVHVRQSASAADLGFWGDIARRAERRRSELLTLIKRPGFSLAHMAAVLVAEGWIQPLARMLVTRDWREYLANTKAAWRVAFQMRRVVLHARLSAEAGQHFL